MAITEKDLEILRDLKSVYNLRDYIYTYYSIMDMTHVLKDGCFIVSFDENETMKKVGEESINVISAMLVDSMLNNKLRVSVNDIGDIPSKSDMLLSSKELLEMKRVPIGTKAYGKGKPKYNPSPNSMIIDDAFDFIKGKVEEYSPINIGHKQKADYIGFYFAVSNFDLLSSSISYLHIRFYNNLKSTLNVFNDVFLIFNRLNLYDGETNENTGETICLSLKTGDFNSLKFHTPYVTEQHIKGNIDEPYTEEDIISSSKEKHIVFSLSSVDNTYYIMNSGIKGVCVKIDENGYGFGNLPCCCYTTALLKKESPKRIICIGKEQFSHKDNNIVIPFFVEIEKD